MPLFHEPPLFRFYPNQLAPLRTGIGTRRQSLAACADVDGSIWGGRKTPPPPPGINDNQNALIRID